MRYAQADRGAPPIVPAINHKGVRYAQAADTPKQRKGSISRHLAAIDVATNATLWTLEIFSDPLVEMLETDVQEIYFKSMTLNAKRNELTIEREYGGEICVVNLTKRTKKTKKLRPVGKPGVFLKSR
ncbi:MAG: hypothetical protein AAB263_06715 [Planctomycetota bacterium]